MSKMWRGGHCLLPAAPFIAVWGFALDEREIVAGRHTQRVLNYHKANF